MSRHQGRPETDESEINVTPMLDIVFIMLIFFIVSTAFVRETGIDPMRPPAETASDRSRGNVLLAISAGDEIWFDRRRIAINEVRTLVEGVLSESPESSVVIVADELASSGLLVDVLDQVKLAGIVDVAVATRRP